MRILIDTNIVLRLNVVGHIQHQSATEAVDRLDSMGHELVVVPQVFYEYWVVATRPVANNGLGLSTAMAAKAIEEWETSFVLHRDESDIYDRWRNLVSAQDVKGKSAHDARLVAAMERHGITCLLTFNGKDFARFTTISVFSPDDVVAGRVQI